jgi:hypothetical protein
MGAKLATMLTRHGTLRAYYYRFKMKDDPECVCRMGPQTTNHLVWECGHLLTQSETSKNRVRNGWRKLAHIQLRSSQQLYEMVSNICQLCKLCHLLNFTEQAYLRQEGHNRTRGANRANNVLYTKN